MTMNVRGGGTRLQRSTRAPAKHDERVEMLATKSVDATKPTASQQKSSRERKLALQQDVDKLKKKLRHEENVHKALERAFTRPLGTLPRLPPYLPTYTLELLAEVAVLEEEVLRLEEQVVHFRQGLYQEAVYISSSKRKIVDSSSDFHRPNPVKNFRHEQSRVEAQIASGSTPSRTRHLLSRPADACGEDKQACTNSTIDKKGSTTHKSRGAKVAIKGRPVDNVSAEKYLETQKSQLESRVTDLENAKARNRTVSDDGGRGDENPNKISENVLKCLLSIFLRKSSKKSRVTSENSPFLSTIMSEEGSAEMEFLDPYGVHSEYGKRDIGPYKHLYSIHAGSINPNRTTNCVFLEQRLKVLLGKLGRVKLENLTHQEKLAFWINIYNSCMMKAFLEHGIQESPHVVVALMQQATINVGGHLLTGITIEHFILRLPYHLKYTSTKGTKNVELTARRIFGLELSEPLVTFALSCGSWSSPAVRVYTASNVENELEAAKRDYLQAAVGISAEKFVIPKLLDWYLLDFAKDLDSLLDWICLQLPSELGKQAIKFLEMGKSNARSKFVQVVPYDFTFRYLLYTQ
ncbi:uncharacterized protein LOC115675908 [Syzygium oleosum]|uniref:uncharacterized protein LOC115675908 n=1 Tax=Syzygium oleosum TaxID=219896 RepID=UPI0011D2B9FE|nr:uncharacterized protein LOC115675908 [Syzygium oleosum]